MREILFKAKDLKSKKWVIGSYVKYDEEHVFILPPHEQASTLTYTQLFSLNAVMVDPETVCQYTGLKDKNEVKIFEGDIIKHYTDCVIDEYSIDIGRIFWYQQTQRYLMTSSIFPDDCKELSEVCKYEVIGNIHDEQER